MKLKRYPSADATLRAARKLGVDPSDRGVKQLAKEVLAETLADAAYPKSFIQICSGGKCVSLDKQGISRKLSRAQRKRQQGERPKKKKRVDDIRRLIRLVGKSRGSRKDMEGIRIVKAIDALDLDSDDDDDDDIVDLALFMDDLESFPEEVYPEASHLGASIDPVTGELIHPRVRSRETCPPFPEAAQDSTGRYYNKWQYYTRHERRDGKLFCKPDRRQSQLESPELDLDDFVPRIQSSARHSARRNLSQKSLLRSASDGIKIITKKNDIFRDYIPRRPTSRPVRITGGERVERYRDVEVQEDLDDDIRTRTEAAGAASVMTIAGALGKLNDNANSLVAQLRQCISGDVSNRDLIRNNIPLSEWPLSKGCLNLVGPNGARNTIQQLRSAFSHNSRADVLETLNTLQKLVSGATIVIGSREQTVHPSKEAQKIIQNLRHIWGEGSIRHMGDKERKDLEQKTIRKVGEVMWKFYEGMQLNAAYVAIMEAVLSTAIILEEFLTNEDKNGSARNILNHMIVTATARLNELARRICTQSMTLEQVTRAGNDILYHLRVVPEKRLPGESVMVSADLRKRIAENVKNFMQLKLDTEHYIRQMQTQLRNEFEACAENDTCTSDLPEKYIRLKTLIEQGNYDNIKQDYPEFYDQNIAKHR